MVDRKNMAAREQAIEQTIEALLENEAFIDRLLVIIFTKIDERSKRRSEAFGALIKDAHKMFDEVHKEISAKSL